MRKYLILLSLILCKLSFAQNLPIQFRIAGNISNINPSYVQSNKLFQSVRSAPVTSATIISNFISDILVAGDTIWFGTGKGICRTVNNGVSFQNYYNTEPF